MPLSIRKIEERRRTVEVDVGEGDTFSVTYRPAAYTSEFESEIRAAAQRGDNDVIGRMYEALIDDWDLYEDDGQKKKVPISAERVKSLPSIITLGISEAIGSDIRPNRKTGGSFSGG